MDISFLILGIIFGLSSGISPGPLQTLVVSETLKNNRKNGIKVAIAPFITDPFIILMTTLILSKLSNFDLILGSISIIGSIFLSYLAYKNIIFEKFTFRKIEKIKSLEKGIIANFLNPNPYIFWFTVGGPTVLKALEVNIYTAIFFFIGFYFFLFGSLMSIAIIVDEYRNVLKSDIYKYLVKFTGILLLFFALSFLIDGLRFFKIL